MYNNYNYLQPLFHIMTKHKSIPLEDSLPRSSYHHGNLRRVLIDSAIQLIEIKGIHSVSVREVAKIAKVSPAAPFRHFATRTALLTAIAEEAMDMLVAAINSSLELVADKDPLAQFHSIGVGFLRWAFTNPIHFQVISTRALIDYEGSSLRKSNDTIRIKMNKLMSDAQRLGLLRQGDSERHLIAARALVYGLGRMYLDGQFPSWELNEKNALEESIAILDQFIASIRI